MTIDKHVSLSTSLSTFSDTHVSAYHERVYARVYTCFYTHVHTQVKTHACRHATTHKHTPFASAIIAAYSALVLGSRCSMSWCVGATPASQAYLCVYRQVSRHAERLSLRQFERAPACLYPCRRYAVSDTESNSTC